MIQLIRKSLSNVYGRAGDFDSHPEAVFLGFSAEDVSLTFPHYLAIRCVESYRKSDCLPDGISIGCPEVSA